MPYLVWALKQGTGTFNWMSRFNLGSYSGGTYYVDGTNGSDSNPGTEAQPWATVMEIKDRNITNAAIIVKPGTYRDSRYAGTTYLKGGLYWPNGTKIIAEEPGTVIIGNDNAENPGARDANMIAGGDIECYGIIFEYDNAGVTANYSRSMLRWSAADFYNCVFRPKSGTNGYASLNYNNPNNLLVSYNNCVFEDLIMVEPYSGAKNLYVNNCVTTQSGNDFPLRATATNESISTNSERFFNNVVTEGDHYLDASYKFNNPTDTVAGVHSGTYSWSNDTYQLVLMEDDFEDGTVDTSKWSIETAAGTVSESNGELVVTRDSVTAGSWMYVGVYGAGPDLDEFGSNDFEAIVDIDRTGAPTNSSSYRCRATLRGYDRFTTPRVFIENNSTQLAGSWSGYLSSAIPYPNQSDTISQYSTGKLKLARSRGRWSAYYNTGSGWKQVSHSVLNGAPMRMDLLTQSLAAPPTDQVFKYDNFSFRSNIQDTDTPPSVLVEDFTRGSIHPVYTNNSVNGASIFTAPWSGGFYLPSGSTNGIAELLFGRTITGDYEIEYLADWTDVVITDFNDRHYFIVDIRDDNGGRHTVSSGDMGNYNRVLGGQPSSVAPWYQTYNFTNGTKYVWVKITRVGSTVSWYYKEPDDNDVWMNGGSDTTASSDPITYLGFRFYSQNGITQTANQILRLKYLRVDSADGYS